MSTNNTRVATGGALPPAVCGFQDTEGHRWVEIRCQRQAALLSYNDFVEPRGLWSKLAQRGLSIVRKDDKRHITEQIEALHEFTPKLIFARPGWCNGQFASVSGKVFSPPQAVKGAIAFTTNPRKCSRKGTHAKWMEHVAGPLSGHSIPSFFVMAAFAAPLLELVGRTDNFGFELAGAGGKGKSTTQRLMASVVGPAMEKDGGYITTFDMTPAGFERSMQWHSDMPFIIDEANLFGGGGNDRGSRRMMRDFSFQMASGTTRGRFDTPGQRGYRFVYVTSSNAPFNTLLGDSHNDVANAASDRLMTITVPDGDAGVFGPLPSRYDSYRAFTLALETGLAQHYGTAMPKFLRRLVKQRHANEEGLKSKIRQRIDAFKAKVAVNDNNGSDVRVAEAFGLVYAAGVYARHIGVLPAEFKCLEAALHCYANFRSTVPVRQTLPERLLAIAARPETRTIDGKMLPDLTNEQMEAAGAFIRRVKRETLLLMTPTFGQLMFPDWNVIKGTADFAALNKANESGRGRGYHCQVRGSRRADWFYAFRMPQAAASD